MKRLTFNGLLFAGLSMILMLSSCEKESGTDIIQIKFQNISEYNMNHVIVSADDLGTLDAGESTEYLTYEYFSMNEDKVATYISALVGEVKYEYRNYGHAMFCGMGMTEEDYAAFELEGGDYTITLDVVKKGEEKDAEYEFVVEIKED